MGNIPEGSDIHAEKKLNISIMRIVPHSRLEIVRRE
jgi:hypothetical protein